MYIVYGMDVLHYTKMFCHFELGGGIVSELLLIIPAFNEEQNIENVINELSRECPDVDYIIINDGSKDGTLDECRKNGYNVISHPVNMGLSCAIKTGMKYAEKNGYKYVLQFDADGQHSPRYIYELLKKIKEGNDIVIGSRFVTQQKPKTLRMLGSNMISLAIKISTGKNVSDPTSGMRLYDRKCIKMLVSDTNYGPEPDTISYLIKNGATIEEVQVEMRERNYGESYLRFGTSIKYMIRQLTSILILQNYIKKN